MEEIRTLCAGDLEAAWALDRDAFHAPVERREGFLRLDPARFVGAFDAGRLVGIAAAHAMRQYFGGRAVPMGGVHSVAVAPDRRGRGLGRRLLAALLAAMRERGEALSTLFPATSRPYRAVGYELAGATCWRRVAPRTLEALPRPERAEPVPIAAGEIPLLAECHEAVARATNGFVARSARWWEAARDSLWADRSVFAARDAAGRIGGYVVYRQLEGEYTSLGGPFRLALDEILWRDRDAGLALWRLLGSWAAQVDAILWRSTAEEPLLLLLPEQELGLVAEVRWMTRLVDPAAAVEARGFPEGLEAEAHVELEDAALPANSGRYVLRVAKGRGALERGGRGDLRLDAGAFASLFTGWATPERLAQAGRLSGDAAASCAALASASRAGLAAASRAALAAAFAGPTPWMPEQF
jgi:predicted acetyltransferase